MQTFSQKFISTSLFLFKKWKFLSSLIILFLSQINLLILISLLISTFEDKSFGISLKLEIKGFISFFSEFILEFFFLLKIVIEEVGTSSNLFFSSSSKFLSDLSFGSKITSSISLFKSSPPKEIPSS